MNFFLHPKKRVILIANLKVMFSSLLKQEDLISLPPLKLRELLMKRYLQQYQVFFLTRNPYARIVSNYFDKFVYNPQAKHYHIQNCQQLYLRHLGVYVADEKLEKTKEKLMQIDFDDYVNNLPALFMEDFHFAPQTTLKIGKLNGCDRINSKIFHRLDYRIIQMETDLNFLFDELSLNPAIHTHKTKHGSFHEYFTSDMYAQVNKIYSEDFKYLGYDKLQ